MGKKVPQKRRKAPPVERHQLPTQSARAMATRSRGAAAAVIPPKPAAPAAPRGGLAAPVGPAAPTAAEIDAWMAEKVPAFNAARAPKGLGVLSNASLAHLRGLAPSKILASRRGDLEGSFVGSALQAPWDAQFTDAARHGNPPPGEVPLPITGAAAAPAPVAAAPVVAAAAAAAPTSSALVSSTAAATSSGLVAAGIDTANILTGARSRTPLGGIAAYRRARTRRTYLSGVATGKASLSTKAARRSAPELHPAVRHGQRPPAPSDDDVDMTSGSSTKKRSTAAAALTSSSSTKMAAVTGASAAGRGGSLRCSLYHLIRTDDATESDSPAPTFLTALEDIDASGSSSSVAAPAEAHCYLTHQLHSGLTEWWCDRCETPYAADDPTYCCREHDFDVCSGCVDEMRSDGDEEIVPLALDSDVYTPPYDANGFPTITPVEWNRFKSLYAEHKSAREWLIEPTYWVRVFYVVSNHVHSARLPSSCALMPDSLI
jgi:hypothetical protein